MERRTQAAVYAAKHREQHGRDWLSGDALIDDEPQRWAVSLRKPAQRHPASSSDDLVSEGGVRPGCEDGLPGSLEPGHGDPRRRAGQVVDADRGEATDRRGVAGAPATAPRARGPGGFRRPFLYGLRNQRPHASTPSSV